MKKNLKKLLAFFCALVLLVTACFTEGAMKQAQAETETSAETTDEVKPVELYGFQNVTLNSLADAKGNVMVDNEYSSGCSEYILNDDAGFHEKLFTAWVTINDSDTKNWWEDTICFGATAGDYGWGLRMTLSEDGKSLVISDADIKINTDTQIKETIAGSKVEMDSFRGREFLLQMGYQFTDEDGDGVGDLRILVYINGKEGLNIVKSNCNQNALGNRVRVNIDNSNVSISVKSVDLPIRPVELEGFTNVDVDDFVDSTGAVMKEQDYINTNTNRLFHLTDNSNSFDKKLFTAKVNFSHTDSEYWWNTRLHIGGTGTYTGIAVYTDGSTLKIQNMTQVSAMRKVASNEVGLTSFFGDPFLLQVGYEYIDTNSTRLLVYVEGTKVYDANVSGLTNLGGYIHLDCYETNSVIGIRNFEEEAQPVTLCDHDTVTISDFQDSADKEMEAKVYDYDSTTPHSYYSLKDGSTDLNGKLLSMKVKFGYRDGVADTYWDNRINIPTPDGGNGIFVWVDSDDQLCIDDKVGNDTHDERITCAEADVKTFKNNPFILQMSFTDTDSGLKLDVYINGKLCKTIDWWSDASTSEYRATLDMYRNLENAFIIVSDVDATEFPADPKIMPDETFEKITFKSFGIENGTYSSIVDQSISEESLHQKVLCGKIKIDLSEWFTFRIGGNGSEWKGLYLSKDNANIQVRWAYEADTFANVTDINGNVLTSFTSDDAGVTLYGTEYNLMISMEKTDVDGDGTDDVKLGVWFEEQLYKNQYYYVFGHGDSLGNKFGFNSDNTTTITLNSVAEGLPQPDASYERVTFQHFLVEDGEYESEGAAWIIHNNFKKKDDLDKIVLCGDIQLKGGTDAYLLALGEKDSDPYQGIFMWINGEAMTLSMQSSSTGQAVIASEDAGVGASFVGKQFSLMWTVEFMDSDNDSRLDDVKVQLWFDGSLCVEKIFVDGGTAEELGNTFSVCCSGEGDSIILNSSSKLLNLPGEEFEKLSLSDFVHDGTGDIIEDSTYSSAKTDGWYVSGNIENDSAGKAVTMNKKVTSFDVLQSGTVGAATYRMRIGGIGNHWYGLVLNTDADGNMLINWCKSDEQMASSEWITVSSNQVAVSNFVNDTFNLMVSMEYIEANGNETSDIKVRIWFNKVPYVHEGQDYIIFYDCGRDIGDKLSISIDKTAENADKKAFVSLRNVAEYQSNTYYYEDISEYRQSSGYTYPEVEGKIFAGWYTDEDYNTPLKSTVTSGSAYAKFTDDEVLRVKSQIKLDSSNQKPTDKTTLRFVTTVDSLNYYRIGFKYKVEGENVEKDSYNSYPTTEEGKKLANKVYKQLQYIDITDENAELMTYEPDAFSWQSMYFKAWNLVDVDANQYSQDVTISAYWITKDGTLVRGEERKICVNDSPTEDTSSKVTIDFLGQNTMPIAGYGIWNNEDAFTTNGTDTAIFPDYDEAQYFQMFADAGVNLINYGVDDYAYNPSDVLKQLENGEKYGLGVFVKDSSLLSMTDESSIQERLALYESKYKSFSGIFLVDEPVEENGWAYDKKNPATGNKLLSYYTDNAAVKYLNDKNYFTYMNLFPVSVYSSEWEDLFPWLSSKNEEGAKADYTDYIDAADAVNSSILSWDHYPFEENRKKDGAYNYSLYFWNMDRIRTTSVASSKPFWAYVQAGSQWKDYNSDGTINAEAFAAYYPSESQFNWIVNTSLAFGAQGIQYYPLIQPVQHAYDGVNAEYDFEVNGILSAWGGKTQWYYYAQEINKHIAEIDEVLMNAKTEKVVVPSSGNAYTQMKDLSSVAISYGVLSGVTGDALVGYFNYGGKVALYVANNQHWAVGEENSVTTQEVTLTLTNNYNEIIKYENAERTDDVATTNKQLTLTMEAGEGILLVLDGIQE